MYYISAVDCCVNEGERRVMMKSAALLIRNYHAKKPPFDINRSASRVHSCKATINIVTLFNHRGSQCAFRTLKCALEEYARPLVYRLPSIADKYGKGKISNNLYREKCFYFN
jgi:hypothetical protein